MIAARVRINKSIKFTHRKYVYRELENISKKLFVRRKKEAHSNISTTNSKKQCFHAKKLEH
jgi:hypothetical protein